MSWDDVRYDDWQGPKCIRGQWVVAMHTDCRALLTEDQFNNWNHGRPIGPIKEGF